MNKTIIIAEAGVNHNGKINLALKLIDKAALAGADYIKFQHTNPDLISPFAKKAKYQIDNTNNKSTQKKMIEKLHLDWNKYYKEIIKRCKKNKIKFLTSAFSVKDYLQVDKLNMDFIKIPSGEIINYPLLKEISKTKKKIILSTGMSDENEISSALNILKKKSSKKKIILMHCVSDYPTKDEDINLKTILYLKNIFKIQVGFSDHSLGIDAPVAAVALGAKVIEKHFTLNKNDNGPDHMISSDPKEFYEMSNSTKNIIKLLGSGQIAPGKTENLMKKVFRRSITAKKKILKDEILTVDNIGLKRPASGLHQKYMKKIIGKKIKCNKKKDQKINLKDIF